MARDTKNSPRRRPGEVVGVSVEEGDARPVHISCRDHAHTYEIAWESPDDGPVITDLRVTSNDGAPITSDSLRRINAERLAQAAQIYDTPASAETFRSLSDAVNEMTADLRNDPAAIIAAACKGLDDLDDPEAAEFARRLRALNPSEAADWVATAGKGLESMRITTANVRDAYVRAGFGHRGGRPPLSREFLARVRDWAREGVKLQPSYYEYIADRVEDHYEWRPQPDTIKKWIQRCKDPNDLLGTEGLGKDEPRPSRSRRKDR